MNNLLQLKKQLRKTYPLHDTPVGLLHPYWARKPYNIIHEIIKHLSTNESIVMDPFMGSGTTIFSALAQKRNVIGTDINPLSIFIVKNILSLSKNTDKKLSDAEEFLKEYRETILPWFKIENKDQYIERERFLVKGTYDFGNFSLDLTEIVTKELKANNWSKRKILESIKDLRFVEPPSELLSNPIDFEKLTLIPNSRIAIPKGANLSHFYLKKNIAAINFAFDLIEKKRLPSPNKEILRLLISSALPLLRLSDKKASSQWPYWRPRNMLTSRNPIIVLQKRFEALNHATEWVRKNLDNVELISLKKFLPEPNHRKALIKNLPIQSLIEMIPRETRADLILTDPPYVDQAPYLEYSSLWIKLLGLKSPRGAFGKEIVKSDSPERTTDSKQYINRLLEGFDICGDLLKTNGYLVWFYQDHDLRNWNSIHNACGKIRLEVMDIIPIRKQRRSIKTVTSPGKTLDGDLICVFKKTKASAQQKSWDFNKIKRRFAKIYKASNNSNSLFEMYATLIKYSLQEGWIKEISEIEPDARKVLEVLLDK